MDAGPGLVIVTVWDCEVWTITFPKLTEAEVDVNVPD